VSLPQPQPIDGIPGAQVALWVDSAPRAVQVVFRHGAIDLMPLLCRNRQERRCNPPFSTRMSMTKSCAASGKWSAASETQSLCGCVPRGFAKPKSARSHLALSLVVHPSLRSVELSCFERSETIQARPLITAWSPTKLGSNRTHLG
jgi:hypothetical protein